MSPEYLQHPHDCRGSSSAALLESVKLVSSVAGPANELPATMSTTDGAGYGADSTVRIQSTLKFAALYGGYVVDQAVTCPSSIRKIDERTVSTLSSTETALLPLRGQHSQVSGSLENATGSIQSPGPSSFSWYEVQARLLGSYLVDRTNEHEGHGVNTAYECEEQQNTTFENRAFAKGNERATSFLAGTFRSRNLGL